MPWTYAQWVYANIFQNEGLSKKARGNMQKCLGVANGRYNQAFYEGF